MKTRSIIAAALAIALATAIGWQVIAQGPDAPRAPAGVTEADTPATASPAPAVPEVFEDRRGRTATPIEKDSAAIEKALEDSDSITVMLGTRNVLLPLVEGADLSRLASDLVEATKDDPRIAIFHFPKDSLLIKVASDGPPPQDGKRNLAQDHKAMDLAAFLLEVMRADDKGPPRPQANPTLPPPPAPWPSALRSQPPHPALSLGGIGEQDARSPIELDEEFQSLDEQAAKTTDEIRELLSTHRGPYAPRESPQLRRSLRSMVARLFEIRQQVQRRELAEYQSRLARIGQQIEDRESLKDAIIDRRVEELINPALAWEPKQAADSSPKKIGGGAAPAETVVPKDAGAQPPGGEQPKSKYSLREQFVTRFPETVAPEVLGPHRGTFIDEFVDISPDGELVTTVRPADEEDSYACALWDRKTGRRVAETVRQGKPVVVRFSANGEYVGVATFWTNQFEVFKASTGEFVQTVDHEPRTSWEDAFNRYAEEHAGQARDRGGASKLNVEGTILSVDNQRELGIISMGSEDGMRPGTVLRVLQGSTCLGRVTVVETNKDRSLVRMEEENSAMPIRRGDRVTGARPTVAEVGAARMTAGALAWDILGTKFGERPAIGQYQGGLTIQELRAHGPAAQAKLNVGDVLVGLGSWEISSLADLRFALEHPDVRPQPRQPKEVKALIERDGATVSATLTLTAPKEDGGAATWAETEEFAVRGSVHMLIKSPTGATLSWTPRSADGHSLFQVPPGLTPGGARKTLPASFVVAHGQRVPFQLREIPGRGDLRLFGSIEIAPLSEAIFPFVGSSAIPIEITEEDLDRAASGEAVVKLIWVNGADGVRVVNYPSLESGVDPVDEAKRHGVELRRDQVLAILRLSNRYESIGASEEHGPQMEPLQPPVGAAFRQGHLEFRHRQRQVAPGVLDEGQ